MSYKQNLKNTNILKPDICKDLIKTIQIKHLK